GLPSPPILPTSPISPSTPWRTARADADICALSCYEPAVFATRIGTREERPMTRMACWMAGVVAVALAWATTTSADQPSRKLKVQVGRLIERCNALMREGKYEEAHAIASKAKDIDPDNVAVDALLFMASVQRNLVSSVADKEPICMPTPLPCGAQSGTQRHF